MGGADFPFYGLRAPLTRGSPRGEPVRSADEGKPHDLADHRLVRRTGTMTPAEQLSGGGRVGAAISNAVVGVMHDYTGRGPT